MLDRFLENYAVQIFFGYVFVPLLVGVASAIVTTKIYDFRLRKARKDAKSGITGQYRQMVQSIDLLLVNLVNAIPDDILQEKKADHLELIDANFKVFKQNYAILRITLTILYGNINILLTSYMSYKSTENYKVLNECVFTIHCIMHFFDTIVRSDDMRFVSSPYLDIEEAIEPNLGELIDAIFGYRLMADWKFKDTDRVEKDLHGTETIINSHDYSYIMSCLKAVGFYDSEVDPHETHEDAFPIIFLPNPKNINASIPAAKEAAQEDPD